MENDPRTTATDLRQQGATSLAISWLDGARTVIEVRDLRLACACAHCVDEWTGENRLDPTSVPDDVHPTQIEAVGRYAIQIRWSDGHDSGIYPYVRLRALSEGVAGL